VLWFKKADAWLAGVEGSGTDWSKYKSPPKSAEVTVSPQEPLGFDNWGNVHEPRPRSGALVNQLTAPWYLDRLRLRVHAPLAFLRVFFGQVEEARQQLEAYRRLDKLGEYTEKLRFGSYYQRMIWNIEQNQCCLRARPEEAKVFTNPKHRLVMFMGDLAYELEDLEAAKEQYDRLLNGEFGNLSEAERAYLWFAAACCEGFKDRLKAIEKLAVFEKKWKDTPTAPRALFYCAKFHWSGYHSSQASRDEAVRLYDLIEQRYPGSGYDDDGAWHAGLNCFVSGKEEEARRRFDRYKGRYPNGYHKDHLSPEYLEIFRPEKPQPAAKAGD